jgi:hypothetical protein
LPRKCLLTLKPWVNVWEAIGDLPSLSHTDRPAEAIYHSEPFSEFQRIMRGDRKKVVNHIARTLAPIQFERLSSIGPGQAHADLPPPPPGQGRVQRRVREIVQGNGSPHHNEMGFPPRRWALGASRGYPHN